MLPIKFPIKLNINLNVIAPDITLAQLEKWVFFALFLLFPAGIVMPPLLRKGVNFFCYVLAAFLFLRHWRKFAYVFTQDILLFGMHGLAIASIFWSASPDITSESVRALLRTTTLGIYLASIYNPTEQRRFLEKMLLVWGVASLIAVVIPGYGIEAGKYAGSLKGIFSFKYGVGSVMAIAVLTAVAAFVSKTRDRLTAFSFAVIAFIMVVWSVSKTSLFSLVMALMLVPPFFITKYQFKVKTLLYIATALLTIVIVTLFTLNIETIVVDWLGKDLTLTGRVPMWNAIIDEGLKRPLLGYGHGGAFWYTNNAIVAIDKNKWPVLPPTGTYINGFHSHNGFIEMFVQLGWVGLILTLIQAFSLLMRLIWLSFGKGDSNYLWMTQILLLIVIANLTEVGTFLEPNNLLWTLYVAISCSSAVQLRSKDLSRNSPNVNQVIPDSQIG